MNTRRGSSYYRTELARLIDQFKPGTRVLCTYQVIGDSLVGVVEAINRKENKVYVAWNGGAVSQHDPDELALATMPVDNSPSEGKQLQESVEEKPKALPTIEDKDSIIKHSLRRMAGNPPIDNYEGDPEIHGLDDPRNDGFKTVTELVEDLREEQRDGKPEVIGASIGRRRVSIYHSECGRIYRRTRRERSEKMVTCPKCKVEMESRPYTKRERLNVCPECDFKISTSNIV